MNFSQSTFSAILASVIAAGIIALAAYLWKNRIALRNAFKKKETIRKETVEVEQFVKNVQRWESKAPNGIAIRIKQKGLKTDFTTKFDKITEIVFIRNSTPELHLLIIKSSQKQRTAFVRNGEFIRICRVIYFKEVSKWT